MNALLEALRGVVGAPYLLAETAEMAPYCRDWRGRYQGQALCVVRPGHTEEVAAVVRLCADAGAAMVPQGGNTGLCGGGTPRGGEVVISLSRLNRVRAVDAANNTITVEAGCTLAQVQAAALAAGRFFPLSLAAEGSATIGGNLSTNAGGVQVLRYGNARDLALGLEVVLPDGRCWDGLRSLRKDNTGYDLKHWFIGAEGSLGLITAAVLKLYPPIHATATAWVAVADPARAVALLARLRQRLGDRISAFELIGRSALDMVLRHIPGSRDPLAEPHAWYVLVELTDTLAADLAAPLAQALAAGAEAGVVADGVVAASETQAADFWRLRESISEAQRIEGISIKHDVAVPLSRIAEFIERADRALMQAFPGVRVVCFGHVGDGNLHYNPSKPTSQDNAGFIARTAAVNRIVHDLIHDLGGSISAEHGLGQLKREEIRHYKSALEMELMRRLKQALDPRGLMNPGKVV
ncbi:hydroxyacid dehydrogenase [Denitratisoma sp. DHT3]|uniref:FAD-binding oxidoreductase n=1 Tax=Denitratisoma sp. DHT3 TaxID=1981880 RepID=UPI0011982D76|nr:FAD-binding oxidoreductase [Denitratisoma sp. DHT3]QDX80449.1 hydroxyacid dehydrogenase [Denitratisoma sp. DHT3]